MSREYRRGRGKLELLCESKRFERVLIKLYIFYTITLCCFKLVLPMFSFVSKYEVTNLIKPFLSLNAFILETNPSPNGISSRTIIY